MVECFSVTKYAAGFKVFCVNDGLEAVKEALDKLGSPHEYNLVLMDIQMPRLNGLEAITQLRNHHFKTPIIALTANTMEGEKERCYSAGCDDFVAKPIDFEVLFSTIDQILYG